MYNFIAIGTATMTYPLIFRQHVLIVRERENLSISETSSRFHINVASIVRWLKDPSLRPHPSRHNKIDLNALRADVERHPYSYCAERATRFNVTAGAICYALKRLGISRKKNSHSPQSGRYFAYYVSREDQSL